MKGLMVVDFREIKATFVCEKCQGAQTGCVAFDDTDQAGRPCVTVTFTHWCTTEETQRQKAAEGEAAK